jgi:acetyl esterase/lipase
VPLFDAYAGPAREKNRENPRLNPILAPVETLPKNLLMLIPTMDIILHEQLEFVKRVQEEAKPGQRIEAKLFEGQIHGWTERKPSFRPEM